MGLRRQLFLAGAITLLLPLVSVPVVSEMEAALQRSQALALQSITQALATQIIASRELLIPLDQAAQRVKRQRDLDLWFAPAVDVDPVLDGYLGDWSGDEMRFADCLPKWRSDVRCALVRTRDSLFIALEVADADRQFFDPSKGLALSDHLHLLISGAQSQRELAVYSSAVGEAHVARMGNNGELLVEYRVKAAWNEGEDHFTLEVKIPLSWVDRSLAVDIQNGADNSGLLMTFAAVQPILLQDYELESLLSSFQHQDIRLRVVAGGRWIMAEQGELVAVSSGLKESWLRWLLRHMIAQTHLPFYPANEPPGQIAAIDLTVDKGPQSLWWRTPGGIVTQVIAPLDGFAGSGLYVVAEQSSNAIDAMTSGALGKLLGYSILASILVASALLGFATVLSFRVRHLSAAAQAAVDSQGRIKAHFQPSNVADEIGELSRSYALLLRRLDSYTGYLEGLSKTLSHELRTPIAIVRSSLDNLAFADLDHQNGLYLQRATQGLDRLSGIFNALHAAAKIEQSIHHNERQVFDLVPLMRELMAAYRDVYPSLSWHFRLPGDSPLNIYGSAELLAQMMDKLIDNAVEFSGERGAISILVDDMAASVHLSVVNTGPPLPDSLQGSIFDSMVSSRSGDQQRYHLGLGLFVVRLICEFHRGQVRAKNHADGDKVVFEVTLPKCTGKNELQ